MTLIRTCLNRTAEHAARAMLVVLMLAAPVLAVPNGVGEIGRTIEAPAPRNGGIGFVLLVSLQRA